MAEFDRNNTIQELDRIADLFEKKGAFESKLYDIKQEEKAKIDKQGYNIISELEDYQENQNDTFGIEVPSVSQSCTMDPPITLRSKENKCIKDWLGALIPIIFIVTAIIYIVMLITPGDDKGVMLIVLLLFASGFGSLYFLCGFTLPYLRWKCLRKSWKEEFEQKYSSGNFEMFLTNCANYEKRFNETIELCKQKYDQEEANFEKTVEKIHKEYAEKYSEAQAVLVSVEEKLGSVTLIQPDLFDNASRMSKLLRQYRAKKL